MHRHLIIWLSCLLALVAGSCRTERKEKPWSKADVQEEIVRVNDRWQLHYPPSPDLCTDSALYHLGNMAAYQATGNRNFLRYSEVWAERNNWQGCFLAYIDLYKAAPDERKLTDMRRLLQKESFTFLETDNECPADSICRLIPLLSGLYGVTGNIGYLDRLYVLLDTFIRSPQTSSLFTCDNSRIFAATALAIEEVPFTDNRRSVYLQTYSSLAKTLHDSQRPDGSWHSPTAGNIDTDFLTTAFITYGYLWGINHGLPDSVTYRTTAEHAWHYLATHIDCTSLTDGIIGAYLLAATEVAESL